MRLITSHDFIVVHESAGWFGELDFINQLHTQRGFPVGRLNNSCGYHNIILNGYRDYNELEAKRYRPDLDGKNIMARQEDEQGCHVQGLNARSLGICLIGKFGSLIPSIPQCIALFNQLVVWCKRYGIPPDRVVSHSEAQGMPGTSFKAPDGRKECPGSALDITWVRNNIWRLSQAA